MIEMRNIYPYKKLLLPNKPLLVKVDDERVVGGHQHVQSISNINLSVVYSYLFE